MSIVRKLTKEDIGKKIIYCIFCDGTPKVYGEITDFNDTVVFCRMGGFKKITECTYEDLDFDLDMDEFCKDESSFDGWKNLYNRFNQRPSKQAITRKLNNTVTKPKQVAATKKKKRKKENKTTKKNITTGTKKKLFNGGVILE